LPAAKRQGIPLPEVQKVKIGGVFWTKSEPFLSKIQRILRIESRLRRAEQAGKNSFPPDPFSFYPFAFRTSPDFFGGWAKTEIIE
jgi:hypothetical protein